ncbi:bacitracin ABC transporter ATP-binding protein [Aphanothece hegewaldii CCALA 016]|uniref:Bacitracin ABC transporter ATP-binding protein n=1 Tax=Aphanothece hegewaldii CCALA 016 TaxID=2107694 RepID=A0A2T1M254_9CHRO|nr:nitrate ABC transporter ATP-binding protein [Aphanothece hegewaldii]PSF38778.1 bacitracin ABC transporter ATP-binding protein [Aphanothece hegewaldii CCALA 016]
MQTITNTQEQPIGDQQDFLLIEKVTKSYNTPTGIYPVLDEIDFSVAAGEFICVIGHSGCGKSTLLNMIAGFSQPTTGEVRLQGKIVEKPGPDRMMVFQNYSLLPWKTAYENVYLGVNSVYPDKPHSEKIAIVEEHLAMVGLTEAAQKKPAQLSGGMKQRVAIARALAIRPQVLILDEPFGALDAITKEELQDELLKIWQDHKLTVLMITHDIDEALYLCDRLVMMTNGPSAKIGEVLKMPFKRPRVRSRLLEDPRYYELRNYALDFLYNRFAHSEDPTDDTAPEISEKKGFGKIAAMIGGVAVAAIIGFSLLQSMVKSPQNSNPIPAVEAPSGK